MTMSADEELAKKLQEEELAAVKLHRRGQNFSSKTNDDVNHHIDDQYRTYPGYKKGWMPASLYRLPSLIGNFYYWIHVYGPSPYRDENGSSYGKWLIFESERIASTKTTTTIDKDNKSSEESKSIPKGIDELWKFLYPRVQSGELHASGAKVATKFSQQHFHQGRIIQSQSSSSSSQKSTPSRQKPYIICVYTSKERMDEVGLILCRLLQRTISYKTNEATHNNQYAHNNTGRVTIRTCYYNQGNPTFEKPPKKSRKRVWVSDTTSLKKVAKEG